MDRCYLQKSDDSIHSQCICSDTIPVNAVTCIVQFNGQSGHDFASGLTSSVTSFLGSSGLLGTFALSVGVSVLFRLRG